MKELIVLAFDSMDGAKSVRDELYELQKQELLQLDDAGVVEGLSSYDPELIRTNHSPKEEDTLRETFPAHEIEV